MLDAAPQTREALSPTPGLLFVLSGPSGVGKDEAIKLLKERPDFCMHHVVTATTRAIRPNEVDGVHYHFVSREEFARMQRDGELLEWALVHKGYYYGTPARQVREHLARGTDVLLKIDVQGAAQVKQRLPDAVFVFLAPPSLKVLEERLRGRNTESPEQLAIRIGDATREMAALPNYDYCVVNHEGRLSEAVDRLAAIIEAERCRVKRRVIDLSTL
jgi:guanylate kinase